MTLTKNQAQLIIDRFGLSRDRNQCGRTIQCADNNKTPFKIIQFNNGFVFLSTNTKIDIRL